MPRYTCESCETSLYSAARAGNLIDSTCPTCQASLPGWNKPLATAPAAPVPMEVG